MLDEHFFRNQSGRLVAALVRQFGIENLTLAEDVTQEAFCRAIGTWPLRGVPNEPAAWLMQTARRCAIDVIRKKQTASRLEDQLSLNHALSFENSSNAEETAGPGALNDDLLRMMFA